MTKFCAEGRESGSAGASGRVLKAFGANRAGDFAAGAKSQPAPCAVFRIGELIRSPPRACTSAVGREQLAVQSGECLCFTVIGAQIQYQPAPVLDESAGPVDEFLHHCLNPPALVRMAHRCVRPQQAALAYQAKRRMSIAGTANWHTR